MQTEAKTYQTGDFESAQILYVGDPQIGASKGQTQNGEALTADSGAANTAARNDSFAWDRTLDIALQQNPGLDFRDLRRRSGQQDRQAQGRGVCGLSFRQRAHQPAGCHHDRQP